MKKKVIGIYEKINVDFHRSDNCRTDKGAPVRARNIAITEIITQMTMAKDIAATPYWFSQTLESSEEVRKNAFEKLVILNALEKDQALFAQLCDHEYGDIRMLIALWCMDHGKEDVQKAIIIGMHSKKGAQSGVAAMQGLALLVSLDVPIERKLQIADMIDPVFEPMWLCRDSIRTYLAKIYAQADNRKKVSELCLPVLGSEAHLKYPDHGYAAFLILESVFLTDELAKEPIVNVFRKALLNQKPRTIADRFSEDHINSMIRRLYSNGLDKKAKQLVRIVRGK